MAPKGRDAAMAWTSDTILAERADGALSAGTALTRLLIMHREVAAVRRALAGFAGADRLSDAARELTDLLDTHTAGMRDAAAVLAAADDGTEVAGSLDEGLDACRRLFDRMAEVSPTASVAVYSLGDEARLAAATREVVRLLADLGVVAPDRHLLDLGCGIGRLEVALAGCVASITGIDLSPTMVRIAEGRCAGLPGVRLATGTGRDLAPFADRSFDAVVAVDTFPYLYQAGGVTLAATHVREAARVLRAPGDLVILNLSYRGDLARDQADAAALAAGAGLQVPRNGSADLRSWDGRTFHLRKSG